MLAVLLGHAGVLTWLAVHRTRPASPATPPLVEVALLKPTRIADAPATTGSAPQHRAQRSDDGAARPGALRGFTAERRTSGADKAGGPPTVAMHPAPMVSPPAPVSLPAARDVSASAALAMAGSDARPPSASEPASAALSSSDASTAAISGATGTGNANPPIDARADTFATSSATTSAITSATTPTPASSPGTAAQAGEHFALLPSSDLRYDTFFNGAQNQSGTIHWTTDGKTYRLVVSLPVPFIGPLNYVSEGHIDAFGLAPDRYTEQRGRRPADITSFNRSTPHPSIGFTRRPDTIALPDGAQDRFSMIFQLASLVRGDPARYQPGVTREFFVVDNDSGEVWPVQTMGPDRVMRFDGPIDTVHFMRLPRRDGDRRRIDVWLAPSFDWLPVRIMQTEPNGTQVELIYHGGTRTLSRAAQSDSNDSSKHDSSTSQNGSNPVDRAERPERP